MFECHVITTENPEAAPLALWKSIRTMTTAS